MTLKIATKIILSGIVLSFGLGACGSSPKNTASVERVTGTLDGKSPSGYAKPGATVRLDYDALARTEPGQVGDVDINLGVRSGSATVQAQFTGVNGLEILSGQNLAVDLSTGELGTHNVTYTAQEAGKYYIGVYVNVTRENGQSLGRALSIPVQIGDVTTVHSKIAPSKVETIGGQKVIVMEAEETIR